MLFIKQSLSAATTLTALHLNADGKTVAHQASTDTDHTVTLGEMGSDTSANFKSLFNHPPLMASKEAISIVVPTQYLRNHQNTQDTYTNAIY